MAHPHKHEAKASRHAKVHSMHSDAPQDRALVSAAIKRHENKHHAYGFARGGAVGAHAGEHKYPKTRFGADSGPGRLEKTTNYGIKGRRSEA